MKRFHIDGASVVVTGAGSGIGRELAKSLCARGARVALLGRRREALEATAAVLPAGAVSITIAADITDYDSCVKARDTVIGSFGRIDALFNNAGISMRGAFGDTAPQVFRQLVEVDLLGPMLMTRVCIDDITSVQGIVCFVSSLAGLYGLPLVSAYSASKMGLSGLAQSLRAEYAGSGASFTVVHIGLVDNDQGKRVLSADGTMVPLSRPANATRKNAAEFIIKVSLRRRKTAFHTPTGKAMALAVRFAPRIVGAILAMSRQHMKHLYQ